MKAERNKTIDFLPEDAPEYLARCLRVTEDVPLDAVCGRTICGDTFQVAPHLPRGFADLLIVDPPYNLTKDFSGGGFRRTTDANYAAFTRAWIELLLPLLKPDASVYVCCDWRSSPVIGMTLKDFFRLQNRITWQREKGRGAQRNWKNGMEDIWFATRTDDYTFHVDAVKVRRRVRAPYRADAGRRTGKRRRTANSATRARRTSGTISPCPTGPCRKTPPTRRKSPKSCWPSSSSQAPTPAASCSTPSPAPALRP